MRGDKTAPQLTARHGVKPTQINTLKAILSSMQPSYLLKVMVQRENLLR